MVEVIHVKRKRIPGLRVKTRRVEVEHKRIEDKPRDLSRDLNSARITSRPRWTSSVYRWGG